MIDADQKYERLLSCLGKKQQLCVAFSGGIDSTFLLYAAVEALGEHKVVAIYLKSQVCSTSAVANAKNVINKHFSASLRFVELIVDPFLWDEFVQNQPQRCYFCKKQMYTVLVAESKRFGYGKVADGTNFDDLQTDRPGLNAIGELKIQTPLADVGLTKQEIRSLAKAKGLSNYNLDSNSCLATRVVHGQKIESSTLRQIEDAETLLEKIGFYGTRVRVHGKTAQVEVKAQDLDRVFEPTNRQMVTDLLEGVGFSNISICLDGRG